MVPPNITINCNDDPVEVARWCVIFQREYERLLGESEGWSGVDAGQTDASADVAQVNEMVRRWINHSPVNAEKLYAAVRGLQGLGYVLETSRSRSSGGSRTYLRVLRPGDHESAGNMNSESFTFGKTRALVENTPGVLSGRYPSVKWAQPGSVETVIDVAHRFLRP